jgi:hypothetical protein
MYTDLRSNADQYDMPIAVITAAFIRGHPEAQPTPRRVRVFAATRQGAAKENKHTLWVSDYRQGVIYYVLSSDSIVQLPILHLATMDLGPDSVEAPLFKDDPLGGSGFGVAKRRSPVHNHYIIDADANCLCCRHCNIKYHKGKGGKFPSNTSLAKHLKKDHADKISDDLPLLSAFPSLFPSSTSLSFPRDPRDEEMLKSIVNSGLLYHITKEYKDHIDYLLIDWIFGSAHSFSIVGMCFVSFAYQLYSRFGENLRSLL